MSVFVVSLTEGNEDDGTGVSRVFVVDADTFATLDNYLGEPFETTLLTPDTVDEAERVCAGMLTVRGGLDAD